MRRYYACYGAVITRILYGLTTIPAHRLLTGIIILKPKDGYTNCTVILAPTEEERIILSLQGIDVGELQISALDGFSRAYLKGIS